METNSDIALTVAELAVKSRKLVNAIVVAMEYEILDQLEYSAGRTIGDLSHTTGIETPTLLRVMDLLVEYKVSDIEKGTYRRTAISEEMCSVKLYKRWRNYFFTWHNLFNQNCYTNLSAIDTMKHH